MSVNEKITNIAARTVMELDMKNKELITELANRMDWTSKKAERISVNPANGKRYLVPPKLVPVFKPGTTVKNRLKELGDHE